MTYVYPVLSRRAGGISLGVNLNVNNACNWACIYCQVPDLVRGGPPPIDLDQLSREFATLLDAISAGKYAGDAGAGARLADVAFSGNGEPTSAAEFGEAVDRVVSLLDARGLKGVVPIRVITNGSMVHRAEVQAAFRRLGTAGGEIWFKVDRGTEAGLAEVNGTAATLDAMRSRLRLAGAAAPTWIQTCWFAIDGLSPCEEETTAYIEFVADVADSIRGVHLYGIARPSMQPAAGRLTRLDRTVLEALAERMKAKGLTVFVSP
jgi:wyosine [tRNA(Phe)-imidazoG37] synthetase (radical SAM superfamily)